MPVISHLSALELSAWAEPLQASELSGSGSLQWHRAAVRG